MVERLLLPSTKHLPHNRQVFVDMETDVSVADIMDLGSVEELLNSIEIIKKAIKSWNLCTNYVENEKNLPITIENIRKLPASDVHYLRGKLRLGSRLGKQKEKALMLYLSEMREGKKNGANPPFEYIIYTYRMRHGLSWNEALETPVWVMQQDMLFSSLEDQFNIKHK